MNDIDEIDLYEVLGITSGASKAEIKKAYHKAALSHHPDKVAEGERVEAEVRFKAAKQAYEILYDDDKRHLYDTHGMSAFDPSRGGGMGGEPDIDDIFAQMFGGMNFGGVPGMGGMPGGPGGPGARNVPRKGRNVEQEYEVTLEELYKGKTTKFSSTKNVVCQTCKGSGGKQGTKPHDCSVCHGRGAKTVLRQVGPGLVTQETVVCSTCSGSGSLFKDKERCKKCKGKKVTEAKNVLELYIPRGARQGDRIVLPGEADQLPDQEPGDIIFGLVETPHDVFDRAGADLKADLNISLVEALTGFNRVVLTHLDGRGIHLHVKQPEGKILRPGDVLKVPGEGMPMKKSDAKGDLYLLVEIEFPEDGWIKSDVVAQKLRDALPPPSTPDPHRPEETDEVEFEFDANIDDFGAGSGDPRAGAEWEDDDDDEEGGPQCATQ
ncbi:DnaJ-domain-containing protein [Lindgomyces ingoldianus]|uniref:DnaJ-domain-containing protein n=1 Tax=Lindgomyces ingoldianus TaxID=673940 RepID=A0ACB6R730_9PLEO|nr:DnaJ-domain-containing protein [Lindgomyces ingoldianus]KAF2475078.1 DnaJ-domain-containing protein [Lindgomyces ingoldianus]